MSIAYGIITTDNAFVVSDGKITDGQTDFNKTFCIENETKRLIGAFTGYLFLENRTISDLLQEAFTSIKSTDIYEVIELLKNSLKNTIENTIKKTPDLQFETYIIIIGSSTWDDKNIEMHHIWFEVRNGEINEGSDRCASIRAIGSMSPVEYVVKTLENEMSNPGPISNDFFCNVINSAIQYDKATCGGRCFITQLLP